MRNKVWCVKECRYTGAAGSCTAATGCNAGGAATIARHGAVTVIVEDLNLTLRSTVT